MFSQTVCVQRCTETHTVQSSAAAVDRAAEQTERHWLAGQALPWGNSSSPPCWERMALHYPWQYAESMVLPVLLCKLKVQDRSKSQPYWFQRLSLWLAASCMLVRGFCVGKASALSSKLKVILGPECFPSCCFLIACSGSDIFLSSFHQCIPIPSVFHVIPLLLLSPWVMLNTLLPGLIGVASSHLFKVSLLWLESLQAVSRDFCRLAGKEIGPLCGSACRTMH